MPGAQQKLKSNGIAARDVMLSARFEWSHQCTTLLGHPKPEVTEYELHNVVAACVLKRRFLDDNVRTFGTQA